MSGRGDIVDVMQAAGNNAQTSFPTDGAINMYSPSTPRLPPLPRGLQGSPSPKALPTARQSLLTTHIGWWKPTRMGEKEWGQEWRQHLDEKRKLQNPCPEWWVEDSSYSWAVSLEVSALMKKCIKMCFSLLRWEIIKCRNLRVYKMLLWRKNYFLA